MEEVRYNKNGWNILLWAMNLIISIFLQEPEGFLKDLFALGLILPCPLKNGFNCLLHVLSLNRIPLIKSEELKEIGNYENRHNL